MSSTLCIYSKYSHRQEKQISGKPCERFCMNPSMQVKVGYSNVNIQY